MIRGQDLAGPEIEFRKRKDTHDEHATRVDTTYLLEVSAIPARALYQARKAARIPKTPPATVKPWLGAPLGPILMNEMARKRKARSRVKKSMKNATVDFRVHIRRIVVKMNQPCAWLESLLRFTISTRGKAYEEIEAERVVEGLNTTRSFETRDNLEATRSQDDSERKPESAIR